VSTQPLEISGLLSTQGQIFSYGRGAARIVADQIEIASTGTISTLLPADLSATLHASKAPLDLSIWSAHDVINQGTISSSGRLTVSAAGKIVNDGPAALMSGMNGTEVF